MITIYTDGSSLGNPGPGGYAAIFYDQHTIAKELTGAFQHTTNNRMELLAVIKGLEALRSQPNQKAAIFSDSRYVVDTVNKGWLAKWLQKGFKGKLNEDLWRRFWKVYQINPIALSWIEAHAGNSKNERCDQLAREIAKKGPWEVDHGYQGNT